MSEQVGSFLYYQLAADALTDGRPIDGLAFGLFRDMLGREVELKLDDIDDYIANTQRVIESATSETGELVGLPIDAENHDKGDGAGWVVGVERAGDLIRLIPKWTEIGRELIGKGIRRYFSASVDVANKVILGGTLTNWPASRDNKTGEFLLKPVELSTGLYSISPQGRGDVSMSDNDRDTAPEVTAPDTADLQQNAPEETPAQLTESAELIGELFKKVPDWSRAQPDELVKLVDAIATRKAELQVTRLVEEQQQTWEITELAAKLIGSGVRGLPLSIPELTQFFRSLEPAQFEMAKSIFNKITNVGLVEFGEIGHGRQLRKRPLPEVYHKHLREALKAGTSVETFFDGMVELGSPNDYDLSGFEVE